MVRIQTLLLGHPHRSLREVRNRAAHRLRAVLCQHLRKMARNLPRNLRGRTREETSKDSYHLDRLRDHHGIPTMASSTAYPNMACSNNNHSSMASCSNRSSTAFYNHNSKRACPSMAYDSRVDPLLTTGVRVQGQTAHRRHRLVRVRCRWARQLALQPPPRWEYH